MPVAMVGYRLRHTQAQSPIKAPKHIRPKLTNGKRNWQRQRSGFKREEKIHHDFSPLFYNGNFSQFERVVRAALRSEKQIF